MSGSLSKGKFRLNTMTALTLKQKIDSILSSTDGENKPKINRFLGKGVQLFHKLVPVGENTFVFLNDDKNAV